MEPILPYLVQTSLLDKSKTVREQAVNSAFTISKDTSLHHYGVRAFNYDDASRKGAVNIVKQLGNSARADGNRIQADWATYYLIVTTHRVTTFMRLSKTDLKGLRPIPIQPGGPSIELPWVRSIRLSTFARVPAGTTVEILQEQLNQLGGALEELTQRKLGTDSDKWLAWWQEKQKGEGKKSDK